MPVPLIFVTRILGIERDELLAVAWSFIYFFCIMSAYFMLRSVRETMAIISGVQNIPWLFTGTFVLMMLATPVFGWITSRYSRRSFLPWVYYFFIANILIFFAVFTYAQENNLSLLWISRAFFVWLSVFNLFVVSVFWSFMADIYTKQQSRRLFGVISAGGSAGALVGPLADRIQKPVSDIGAAAPFWRVLRLPPASLGETARPRGHIDRLNRIRATSWRRRLGGPQIRAE
jgi:AAA family ATP:ADP antiporter